MSKHALIESTRWHGRRRTLGGGRASRGFTLIELMVAVGIVAILAAIAYPAYSGYTVAANRSAAQQFLLDVASRQERYLMDTRRYAGSLEALAMKVPARVDGLYESTISVDNSAAPPLFVITATPRAGASQAGDYTLSLNSAGVKTPADTW